MSKQTMKATIDAQVKQNGQQLITGDIMNSVLNQMVDGLGAEDEVVHKAGAETITGLKTFSGSLDTNGLGVAGGPTRIAISADAPFVDRADQLVIEGEEGPVNILVERDPLVPMETATKQYVDNGLSTKADQSELSELEGKVDGVIPASLALAPTMSTSQVAIPNTLTEGINYTLKVNARGSWLRFGFLKETTSAWGTNDAISICFTKEEKDFSFIAPNPSVYKYIAYYGIEISATIEVWKDAVIGDSMLTKIENLDYAVISVNKEIGQNVSRNITSEDLTGLIYSGGKVVATGSAYNSFIIELYNGLRVNIVGTTLNVMGFNSYPVVNDVAASTLSKTFIADGSVKYAMVTFNTNNYVSLSLASGMKKEIADAQNAVTPFAGKTIVCFGDSITEYGANASLGGKRYSDWLAEVSGANVINVGFGNTNIHARNTPSITPTSANQAFSAFDVESLMSAIAEGNYAKQTASATYLKNDSAWSSVGARFEPIVERLSSINWSNVSAITIMAGTNDWNSFQNLSATIASIKSVLQTFLTKYSNIKVYWFTPIVRWVKTSDGRSESNWSDNQPNSTEGKTLEEYANAIIAEVKKYGTPICDTYHTLGWNMFNFSQYFPDTDATHPTKGFEQIGRKLFAFINANRTF